MNQQQADEKVEFLIDQAREDGDIKNTQEYWDDREHAEHEDFMSREETISLNEQAER